ncbi:PAC2 family protein [Methanobrevibacter cuticularis]|uniref:PAC2 family protein n=1 Tax=Methanobrevibacter cuticularis TaxID=47311 RepID=A0A166DCC7_9EURY|nr:proteasome assembly chaperone family protein [Methanobrevibacter cuticularis]KZX15439.1 PAC2 family protein [Methanobrevibacter cuticularis]
MIVETETDCCKIVAEDIENAVVLEGSPGAGLIGNIIGWLLVDHLKMREIGYIESKYFPPLAVLYNGVAIHPFRIYEGDGLVLFLSDFIVPQNIVFDMTNSIVEWMDKNNSKEVVTFNSAIVREKKNPSSAVANSKEALERIKEKDIPTLQMGNLNGISGTILTQTAKRNIPGTCILAETLTQYPDPRAAAEVVQTLNKLIEKEIDYSPLIQEAQDIESRLKKLADEVNKEPQPPIYI